MNIREINYMIACFDDISFLKAHNLTNSAGSVFKAIFQHANYSTLECFPSVARIAKVANLCEKTVQRAIKNLEQKKFIKIESRGRERKSNKYDLGSASMSILDSRKKIDKSTYEKLAEASGISRFSSILLCENTQNLLNLYQNSGDKHVQH